MRNLLARSPKLVLAVSVFALVGMFAALPAAATTCYGTYYEYYDGPAQNNIVGAKVSCPGYPDQWDEEVVTPWYSTETVVCPCPSGGSGGGQGGGEDTEDSGE